jgi:hypothetical protein
MSTQPRFRRHVQQFIGVWAGDDSPVVTFDGTPIVFPPINKVADPKAKHSPYRFASATDRAGKPLPGTVLIESTVSMDPNTGGPRVEFDALEWADGIENTSLGKALKARGFSIVSEPEEVPEAHKAGRPLWLAKQKETWRRILDEERARRLADEKAGRAYSDPSNPKAIDEAVEGLKRISEEQAASARSLAEIESALGIAKNVQVVEVAPEPKNDMEQAAKLMFAAAKKSEVNLTKAEIVGLFEADPEVVNAVDKKLTEAGVDWAAS